MKLFLDSSAVIEVLKGSAKGEGIKRLLSEASVIHVTQLNLYEVKYYLLAKSTSPKTNKVFDVLMESFKILPLTDSTSIVAATLKFRKPELSAIDCICYSTALEHELVFVTCDKDFSGFENVRVF